ncbi:MAG: hypothetical protein LUH05_06535 [Candidatus Gastranaerophilales bacterium]|nr:hypothetical protein [Candidatus Gastranaerophilales bacterium]
MENPWNSYSICIFIINIFIALGTCGAVLISLGLWKRKEKLEGWYWLYPNYIRVHIVNKSNQNCILEKGSYLWITMGKNSAELQTHPLQANEIVPANLSCNIHYTIDDNTYKVMSNANQQELYLYTLKGTLVKLKMGTKGSAVKIKLDEKDETQI